MFDRFTDRARKVMALANQESERFNHEYIGTEHILLGLVKEGTGVGAKALKELGVNLRAVRAETEKLVKSGPKSFHADRLPQTPRAKKAIEYAIKEARKLNHNYVGTEHLLLSLAREQAGVAAQVLMNMGLKLEDVRQRVFNLLGVAPAREAGGGPSALQNEHLQYWRELAAGLKQGRPLLEVLKAGESKVADAKFRRAAKAVIDAVTEGSTLSEAMSEHESIVSRHVCALVRAGEAGGVLDVICERIARAHAEGTLGPDATGPEGEHARYWRTFGLLLSSGVPILEALDLVADVVGWIELANASRAVREAVRDGDHMCSAMRRFPEVFPEPICAAVEAAEGEGELDRQAVRIADALDADDLESLPPSVSERTRRDTAEAEGPTVVQRANQLLLDAVQQGASDIHLDPTSQGGLIRLRVDGVLREVDRPGKEAFSRIVNRIKIMSAMDVAERRLPQDGRIMARISGQVHNFRVSLVPVHFGERVVLRILRREAVTLGLEDTGLSGDDLAAVRRLSHLPNGVIICAGPTGCGKTTLMYSMLQEVDRAKCCVITIEDPVEYSFEGMGQIQTDAQRGLTYARALRHVLRQDPDVIMVGEIRDLQTLQACVQCALTGHLVLSTVHTNTGAETIRRLIEVGLEPYRLSASLAAVIAQRLVRKLCEDCRKQIDPPPHSVPPEGVEFIRAAGKKAFYGPVGCKACGGGYRGRTAIHEILVMDESIRQAVADGADMAALEEAVRQAGTKTMLISGLEKAARGVTSVEEVIRVAPVG